MSRKNKNNRDADLYKKIDEALLNAQNDKKEALNEIDKIKSWAAEAIIEAYSHIFPNGHLTFYREKYKNDALGKYEEIKKEHAEKIGIDKAEKCDQIVTAYMNQIKVRESKVNLYDKLVKNYEMTKGKIHETQTQQKEAGELNKHEERLKQLDGLEDDYVDAMTDKAQMEDLIREFEHKAEYAKQLALLNEKYKDGSAEDFSDSSAFKDEIDKLIDEID